MVLLGIHHRHIYDAEFFHIFCGDPVQFSLIGKRQRWVLTLLEMWLSSIKFMIASSTAWRKKNCFFSPSNFKIEQARWETRMHFSWRKKENFQGPGCGGGHQWTICPEKADRRYQAESSRTDCTFPLGLHTADAFSYKALYCLSYQQKNNLLIQWLSVPTTLSPDLILVGPPSYGVFMPNACIGNDFISAFLGNWFWARLFFRALF